MMDMTTLQQDLCQDWQNVYHGAGQAIDWVMQARASSQRLNAQADSLVLELRRARNTARSLGVVSGRPMTIGFFAAVAASAGVGASVGASVGAEVGASVGAGVGAALSAGERAARNGHQDVVVLVEEGRALLARSEKLWEQQSEISSYQKGVSTTPDDPYAHAALATAYRMAGRYDDALRTYRIALSLDPANLEFQNNLASLHFLRHDTLAAIQTYERILEQDPAMVEVWVNLGVLYALAGVPEGARRSWQQALAYRPGDPTILGYLARLNADRRSQ